MRSASTGYLVVLQQPEQRGPDGLRLNPNYAGVDRLPLFPSSNTQESEELYNYYFGNIKDIEANLIVDIVDAAELASRLSVHPRGYCIILCSPDLPDSSLPGADRYRVIPAGFDVATLKGDCWSIVKDFPVAEWADSYRSHLNQYGLFPHQAVAEKYLSSYRMHQQSDFEMPFEITHVSILVPNDS